MTLTLPAHYAFNGGWALEKTLAELKGEFAPTSSPPATTGPTPLAAAQHPGLQRGTASSSTPEPRSAAARASGRTAMSCRAMRILRFMLVARAGRLPNRRHQVLRLTSNRATKAVLRHNLIRPT
jgi:hypothetical protein